MRNRRSFGLFDLVLIVAVAIATLCVALWPTDVGGEERPAPVQIEAPVRASVTPEQRANVRALAAGAPLRALRLFLRTAVVRRNLGRGLRVVGPTLRQGLTRRQWLTGNIPVVPFVGEWDWRETYYRIALSPEESTAKRIAYSVALHAPTGEGALFLAIAARFGERWLIDYWAPVPMSFSRGGGHPAE
jgi:hypothetical protein